MIPSFGAQSSLHQLSKNLLLGTMFTGQVSDFFQFFIQPSIYLFIYLLIPNFNAFFPPLVPLKLAPAESARWSRLRSRSGAETAMIGPCKRTNLKFSR